MRVRIGVLAAFVAAPLVAQQPAPTPAPQRLQGGPSTAAPSTTPQAPLVIYQVDLVPTGHALAIGKPHTVGNAWFFTTWPERTTVKVPKDKVKKITPRTKDLNQEVVYQVDLLPSGRIVAKDEPVLKGRTYTLHKWVGGNLMSVRQSDVAKITRLTGLDAYRVQQQETGGQRIGDLSFEGTGDVTVLPGGEPPPAAPAADQQPPPQGNWTYQGVPGVSDAYAPPSAVQASPGDVPKAAPVPTQPPQ